MSVKNKKHVQLYHATLSGIANAKISPRRIE
jgi:hypothetical protein